MEVPSAALHVRMPGIGARVYARPCSSAWGSTSSMFILVGVTTFVVPARETAQTHGACTAVAIPAVPVQRQHTCVESHERGSVRHADARHSRLLVAHTAIATRSHNHTTTATRTYSHTATQPHTHHVQCATATHSQIPAAPHLLC